MRISTTMMMQKYADILNEKYSEINKYSDQLSTTRSFQRASEDPVAAMQTIKACHEYTENSQYQGGVSQASSWIQATETTVKEVQSILKSANEKATEMKNGTNSKSDLGNYAVAMKSYRDEIVSTLNTTYSGQYIFGGSTKGDAPFKLDDSGNLMYYNYNSSTPGYVNVNTLTASDVKSMKTTMPINLGLGLTESNGVINSDSVFDASTSGLDVIISGYSSNGKAENIVDNLTSLISGLNNGDSSGASNALTQVSDAQNSLLKVRVAIGEKDNMLTEIQARLTDNESNLTSSLANSMEVDSVSAIMKYNVSQIVYKESMSISSTVLQQSLIDFLK